MKPTKGWTPPGEEKPAPRKPARPEPGARARAWRRMLDEGVYASQSELARGEGVSAAAVSRGVQKVLAANLDLDVGSGAGCTSLSIPDSSGSVSG